MTGLPLRDRENRLYKFDDTVKWVFLFLFLFNFSGLVFARDPVSDSLSAIYHNKKLQDTTRIKAIHAMAWRMNGNNPDSAILWANEELKFIQSVRVNHKEFFEARAYNTLGVASMNKSDFQNALNYLFKSLHMFEELKNKAFMGSCYDHIGTVYLSQSNFPKALDFFLKNLKIVEETKEKKGLENCYNNLGNVYLNLENFDKALEYYQQSLKIYEEHKDKMGIGACMVNLGIIYDEQGSYNKALDFYQRGLSNLVELNDKQGIADCYMNISDVYASKLEYPQALAYVFRSLELRKEIGDRQGIGSCFGNLGDLYNKQENYKLAKQYCDSALLISKSIADINGEREAYENLSDIYAKTERYKEAYDSYVKFKILTDSIFNVTNNKQLGDIRTQFEVEKKEAELKLQAETEAALNNAERKRQQFVIYAVLALLIMVLLFSMLLYKRFRLTNKQKHIIELKNMETEEQKLLVEEKQKEIIDSITYAKRLQQAILPAESTIKKHLPDSFVLYQPKDIVAGDFYWIEHLDGFIFIAAADSTGHGVPGAMVSVICSNALNRAVKEFGLRETGKILDKTRELVLETFEKSDKEIKDGMDISLLRIKKTGNLTTEVQWSGANNPLWYIADKKLNEIKPDKQPIGKTDNPKPFTSHLLHPAKDTTFYLMTDGYADQFGGLQGKKFKYRQMNELVVSIQDKSLSEQMFILLNSFTQWKGALEQVDDVTLIGLKI